VDTSAWFDGLPVIGNQPPSQAAAKLREMDDHETAAALEAGSQREARTFGVLGWLQGRERAWQHTGHAFGFIEPPAADKQRLPIRHAGRIPADEALKGARLRVTLDRLRAAEYPGSGTHRVLFDFYAQHQVATDVEHLHFNSTFRVREGEEAAVIGYPVFVGLKAGADGVVLKCFTVNVKNDDDESMLGLMESDVMKTGLRLIATAQPAIAPLSGIALALTTALAKRNRNVPVQDFFLGLDFSNVPTRARLREGSYVAVQIPQKFQLGWDWNSWLYHADSGQVVHKDDHSQLVPYNYVVLGVSRHND
jgi:hypothetical protein